MSSDATKAEFASLRPLDHTTATVFLTNREKLGLRSPFWLYLSPRRLLEKKTKIACFSLFLLIVLLWLITIARHIQCLTGIAYHYL